MATGIETRTDAKGRKRYRGVVYSAATGKRNGPWRESFAEAKAWRTKALGEIDAGTAFKPDGATLRAEAEAFIAGMKTGAVRDRNGHQYKPATIRAYELAWKRIDPELGAHKLTVIRRRDVQALVDRLGGKGMAAGTIRNTLDPLRAIYRRALQRDRVAVNPTADLDVPAANNGRERSATRKEAAALLNALPETERSLWATAVYAGLRRGELRALRWEDIDLAAKMIHVRRGWDDADGEIEPKTRGANRRVPIVAPLGKALRAHARETKRRGRDLVFGRTASEAFYPSTVRARALKAWKAADPPLDPIGLHECRHTFASMMIAAGCNAKALSVVMGHASITITFDTYGHLMPGGEAEVGKMLGAYLRT